MFWSEMAGGVNLVAASRIFRSITFSRGDSRAMTLNLI